MMKLIGMVNLFAGVLNLYTFWFGYGEIYNLIFGLANLAIFFYILSDSEV